MDSRAQMTKFSSQSREFCESTH